MPESCPLTARGTNSIHRCRPRRSGLLSTTRPAGAVGQELPARGHADAKPASAPHGSSNGAATAVAASEGLPQAGSIICTDGGFTAGSAGSTAARCAAAAPPIRDSPVNRPLIRWSSPSPPFASGIIIACAGAQWNKHRVAHRSDCVGHGTNALRHRSRPQSGELPAADAAHVPGARGGGVSRSAPRSSMARCGGTYAEFYARARRLASALAQARHQARRHGLGDARQHAGDARMPLRRADDRRRAQHPQHAARCRRSSPSCSITARAKVLITDREFSKMVKEALALAKVKPLVIDYDDPEFPAPASGSARSNTRISSRDGDPDFAWQHAARRMGRDLAQLHLGHHRRSQGRGLPPPRRGPARGRQRADLRHGQASGLSLDAADVPLQRLVLSRGRSRSSPARMCACARCARRRCTTRSPSTR